jgi:hypothetical protein
MSAPKQIVHIRKVNVGGMNETPRRTTYEVFYPAGKGRKHAEEVRRLLEAIIRAIETPASDNPDKREK